MHLHRAFFMPIQKAFSQQSGNSAGKEHHKPGILRRRRAHLRLCECNREEKSAGDDAARQSRGGNRAPRL